MAVNLDQEFERIVQWELERKRDKAVSDAGWDALYKSFLVRDSKSELRYPLLENASALDDFVVYQPTHRVVPKRFILYRHQGSSSRDEVYCSILVPLGLRDGVRIEFNQVTEGEVLFPGLLALSHLGSQLHLIPAGSPWLKLFAFYGINLPVERVGSSDSPFRGFLSGDGGAEHSLISFKAFGKAVKRLVSEVRKFEFQSVSYDGWFIIGSLYSAGFDHQLTGAEFVRSFPDVVLGRARGTTDDVAWVEGKTGDWDSLQTGRAEQEEWFLLRLTNPHLWDDDVEELPLSYTRGLYGVA